MKIELEHDAIIVFIGAMGTGKSSFAEKHFRKHDVVATDFIREQLTGDFQSQKANEAVFDILYATVHARAKMGMLTVVDSTGTSGVINHALKTAKEYGRPLYGFLFDEVPAEQLTEERMQHRMKVLHVYHDQLKRISRTRFPKEMAIINIHQDSDITVHIKNPHGIVDDFTLDPSYTYVVVPDLHGCANVLEQVRKDLAPTEKVISLGDIVDRGPSSYNTFRIVNEMRLAGQLFGIHSNHDVKFYKWCKKYLKHPVNGLPSLDDINQGMLLSNGLQKTVDELFSLSPDERLQYAQDFVEYYESIPPIRILNKDGVEHIFVHAGVTDEVFRARNFSEFDKSAFIYQGHTNVHDIVAIVERNVRDTQKKFVCHVGHNYGYHNRTRDKYEVSQEGNVTFIEHDVGLGKKEIFSQPVFYRIDTTT